ncbi:MAG: polysaccharide biosynthesis protein, partial [Actinomycetota bacterium]
MSDERSTDDPKHHGVAEAGGRLLERAPDWGGFVQHRFAIQAGMDAVAWIVAILFATFMRLEFQFQGVVWSTIFLLLPLAVLAQLGLGAIQGLYIGRYRFGSFEEVAALFRVVVGTLVVLWAVDVFLADTAIPLSALLASGFIALFLTASARYVWRYALERRSRPGDDAEPVIVFGAGEGGLQVVNSMLRNPESPFRPVALLDDSEVKRNLTINGIGVAGTREDIGATAERLGARALVVAIPSASASLVSELSDLAAAHQLRVLVVPPVRELQHASVDVDDVRPLAPADLLGRREIDTDVASIADYIAGRRV